MKALTTRSSGAWKSAAAKRLLKLAGSVATVEEAVEKVVSNILLEVPTAPTDLEALKQRLRLASWC